VRGGKPLSFFLFIFFCFLFFLLKVIQDFYKVANCEKMFAFHSSSWLEKNVQDMINLTDSKNVRDFRKCSYVTKMFMNF